MRNSEDIKKIFYEISGEHLVADQLIISLKNEVLDNKDIKLGSCYPHSIGIFVLLFDSFNLMFSYRGTMYPMIDEARKAFKKKSFASWEKLFDDLPEIKDEDIDYIQSQNNHKINRGKRPSEKGEIDCTPEQEKISDDLLFVLRNIRNLSVLIKYYEQKLIKNDTNTRVVGVNELEEQFYLDYMTILFYLKQNLNEGLSQYCYDKWKKGRLADARTEIDYFVSRKKLERKNTSSLFKFMAHAERLIGVGGDYVHVLAPIVCYGQLKGEIFFVDRENILSRNASRKRRFTKLLQLYLNRKDIIAAIGDIWQSRLLKASEESQKGDDAFLVRRLTYLAAIKEMTIFKRGDDYLYAKECFFIDEERIFKKLRRKNIQSTMAFIMLKRVMRTGVYKDKKGIWYLYFPWNGDSVLKILFLRNNISDADVRYLYLRFFIFGIYLRQQQEASLSFDAQKLIVQNIRHEIKNAMNAITSEVDMLAIPYGGQKRKEFIEGIEVIKKRALLTSDLTTVVSESNKKYTRGFPGHLISLLTHLTELMNDKYCDVFYKNPLNLNVEFSEREVGNAYRLIFNLMDNAKKARKSGFSKTQISVNVQEKDSSIIVEIANPAPFLPIAKSLIKLTHESDMREYIIGDTERIGLRHAKICAFRLGWTLKIETEPEIREGTIATIEINKILT